MKSYVMQRILAFSFVMLIPACGQVPSNDSSLKWDLYDVSVKGYPY